MIYKEFAEFYDELFDPEMYDGWYRYLMKTTDKKDSILDLACGNGRLAILMAKDGYQVTGADISSDMLTLAAKNAAENKVDLPLIELDMRNLDAVGNFNTISCFDDSLCYLLTPQDTEKVFAQVAKHLNADGVFLFDVITPYQTDEVYPGYMYNYRDDDRAFMWTSYAGEFAEHSVEHDLSFFLYDDKKDAFLEYNELHQEVTYDVEVYKRMLKSAGFKKINVTTNFGDDPYQKNIKRWFFECKL